MIVLSQLSFVLYFWYKAICSSNINQYIQNSFIPLLLYKSSFSSYDNLDYWVIKIKESVLNIVYEYWFFRSGGGMVVQLDYFNGSRKEAIMELPFRIINLILTTRKPIISSYTFISNMILWFFGNCLRSKELNRILFSLFLKYIKLFSYLLIICFFLLLISFKIHKLMVLPLL